MGAAVFNIVMGLVAIAAGLSGKFTFIGTSGSSGQMILVGVGGLITVYGIYQLVRSRRGQ